MGTGYRIGMSKPIAAKYSYDKETKKAKYSEPTYLGEAMTGTFNPNYAEASLNGDDREVDSATELTSVAIALGVTKLPIKAHNVLFGATVEGSKVTEKTTDVANDVGLGFISRQSNGLYTAVIYAKSKFKRSSESYETKGQSVKYNTPTINGTATESDVDHIIRDFEEDLTEEAAWKYVTDVLGDPDAVSSTSTTTSAGQ
ncbi:MAG: hypothetical protein J6K26_09685 [Lachnospiraceae bacterium]|nr:hypothetical protein [Lachnospiraceae bacterium]